MATYRDNPYGAFNYIVALGGTQGDGSVGTVIGGFSDVSGLGVDVSYSEYRNGNEKFNTVPQGSQHAQTGRRHAEARHRRIGRSLHVAQRRSRRQRRIRDR